jgi:sulfane dehydrogenase subunit SoxC
MSHVNENKQLIKRRTLLGGAAAAAVVLVQTTFGKVVQVGVTESEVDAYDPTKKLGQPPGVLGTRSPFEKPVKSPWNIASATPL